MYQFNDISGASGTGTAALSLEGTALRRTFVGPGFGQKVDTLRAHADNFDLVVDLGQRIGSGEWFRGLFTCGALCYAAWSLGPSLEAMPGASPAPLPSRFTSGTR